VVSRLKKAITREGTSLRGCVARGRGFTVHADLWCLACVRRV